MLEYLEGLFAKIARGGTKRWFRLRGLATMPDIPTEDFNALISALQQEGWRCTYEYQGFDAWIDYGCIKLRRGGLRLKCEWDNWNEGSIVGPRRHVESIAQRFGRPVVSEWRWSEWD